MRTLFVLGAGASYPYGFPIGDGLREDIIENIEKSLSDVTIVTRKEAVALNQKFRDSGLTIDKFTEVHAPIAQVPETVINFAKLGIGGCLTQSEYKSNFNEDSPKPDQDWYRLLVQKIFDNVKTKNDFLKICADLTVVTFNYDRSFEFYVLQQMNAVFNSPELPRREFQQEPLPFPVIHVYGSLGSFAQLPYGTPRPPNHGYLGDFNLIGDNMRTDKTAEILNAIKRSARIFFLGFSYQHENMKSLGLGEKNMFRPLITLSGAGSSTSVPEINAAVFGTALGFSGERIESVVRQYFPESARLRNIDCKTLIENFF